MNAYRQRRDPEYGYPAAERKIGFDPEGKCDSLEVLRVGTTFDIETRTLDKSTLKGWISKDVTIIGSEPDKHGGGLRLLLAECRVDSATNNRLLPMAENHFDFLSQCFQLPEQFIASMQSYIPCSYKFSGQSQLDKTPLECFVFKFGIYQPSYYHLAISYSPTKKLTHALLTSKTSDHAYPLLIKQLIANQDHATHPLLLPVLLTDISLASSASRIQLSDDRLNELEETLGQHEWINRPLGDPLKLDFVNTTRTLNFTARTLGVEKMRIQSRLLTLERLLNEVNVIHASNTQEQECKLDDTQQETKTHTWMTERIAYHKDTAQHLLFRVEFEEKRVQMQLAVVYQFMAQKDSKVNIQLAETSARIARDTSKDSSSMKAIAVLTMCFLPGTFLATYFAMPLFDWGGETGSRRKAGFKVYWMAAVPLTVGVLAVWMLSMALPWTRWVTSLLKRIGGRRKGLVSGPSSSVKEDPGNGAPFA